MKAGATSIEIGLVDRVFEQIALIPGLSAAAYVGEDGNLKGWCANSAVSPENLGFVAETCRSLLASLQAEQFPAKLGTASFGSRTLIFQAVRPGLFMAYLDSPIDDGVLAWFFEQIEPLLAEAGVALDALI